MDDIARAVRRKGHNALAIHGDKSQIERDAVLTEFRNGATSILIATDVAARGLDVEDVKFVINFDYPNSSEDYIHRIGEYNICVTLLLRDSALRCKTKHLIFYPFFRAYWTLPAIWDSLHLLYIQ